MNWKQTLHFEKGTVLGLDIGSSAVKMVVLGKDKSGYTVTAAGIARIAKGDPGDDSWRMNSIKATRECFSQMRTRAKYAVCGVSGLDIAVRDFEFSPLRDDEIAAAVSLEASQVCPFNVADIAVDYQVIPDGEAKTKGVLVAATNTIVTDKTQLAKDAGLKCALIDIDGLALLNCYKGATNGSQKKKPTERSIAILNVGASLTTLAIMDDTGWPFIRDMNLAGDDIIMQIAALNDMSTETVQEILFRDEPVSELNLHNSLEKACQKLVTDIVGTLRYYATQTKWTDVESILVCGGFALAKGFIDLLNRRLGTEAVLWNPFDHMRIKSNQHYQELCSKTGPAMAVAAGLAMRTIS